MKKSILFILLLCIIFSMFGCSIHNEQDISSVRFYYLRNELSYQSNDSILYYETRDCTAYKDDALALINYYFAGPETEACTSPFLSSVKATKITLTNEAVNIYLNNRFADIKGLDFTTACACLSKTLMDLYQRDNVKLFAASNFSDGSYYIEISTDTLILLDNAIREG